MYAWGDLSFRRWLAFMLFGIALEIGAVVLELTGPIPAIGLIAFFVALAGGFCALAGALFLAFPSAPNPRA